MRSKQKFFVAPQKRLDNFKVLFARLTAEGAGRPVDEQGLPDGPWTPETLADAISSIEANRNGIELRAVQVWFQDNDNGISNDNIRWLARIFGCDDPEATSFWQAELTAAKERLKRERRERKNKTDAEDGLKADDTSEDAVSAQTNGNRKIRGVNLALRSEAMFANPNLLSMPIVTWCGLGILWFLAFILGVHSVTYSPFEGVHKQVGLIWAPGWNIGDAVFLPIFLIVVAAVLNRWKYTDRIEMLAIGNVQGVRTWQGKIASSSLSHWAILLVCFFLIFLVQWAGVYLFPLLNGDPDVPMIDWLLIALVEPDKLSREAAIFVSFLGFFYAGLIYWFLFTGLHLLFAISVDFAEICASSQTPQNEEFQRMILEVGSYVIQSIFRCIILGILVAFSIKLNAAYLVSDAESITGWLMHDAALYLGFRDDEWMWIKGSPSPFFTSFLLLFLLCFVFVACVVRVNAALEHATRTPNERRASLILWMRLGAVPIILAAGYLLVGQIVGFSLILCISVALSFASLFWRIEFFDNKLSRRNV